MSKYSKYRPNYHTLYPGVKIPPKVLETLHESDLKIEYMENDLKCGRFVINHELCIVTYTASREDSLDRMIEVDMQFQDQSDTPEDLALKRIDAQELRHYISLLPDKDRDLIQALFYSSLSEREYAAIIRMSPSGLHKRKVKALARLKILLGF